MINNNKNKHFFVLFLKIIKQTFLMLMCWRYINIFIFITNGNKFYSIINYVSKFCWKTNFFFQIIKLIRPKIFPLMTTYLKCYNISCLLILNKNIISLTKFAPSFLPPYRLSAKIYLAQMTYKFWIKLHHIK